MSDLQHTKESAKRYLDQAKIREGQREALMRQLNSGLAPNDVVANARRFESGTKYQTKTQGIPNTL